MNWRKTHHDEEVAWTTRDSFAGCRGLYEIKRAKVRACNITRSHFHSNLNVSDATDAVICIAELGVLSNQSTHKRNTTFLLSISLN